ncbi:MAG: TonB-dependent receptor plug domain-containing protein [bacterium]
MKKHIYKNFIKLLILSLALSCGAFSANANEKDTLEFNLDQVVVTATKTEKELKDVANSVSVITRQMIEKSPYNNVVDLLTVLPGVKIQGKGAYGGERAVSLRGLNGGPGSDKVLLLLDGRPVNSAYSSSINWNSIPLENIEKIEVIRGSASALYGTNALGGVINIITRKPDKNQTIFQTSYGTYKTAINSVTTMGKDSKLGYVLSADYGRTDGDREHNKYKNENINLNLDYQINNEWQLKMRSGYHYEDLQQQTSVTASKPWLYDSLTKKAYYIDLAAVLEKEKMTNTVRIYNNNFDNSNDNAVTKSRNPSTLPSKMTENITGFLWQQDLKFSNDALLTWGLDYKNAKAKNKINNKKYSADYFALYLQHDQKLNDYFHMNLGARIDKQSDFDTEISPKFGLVYDAGENTLLRLNIAKSFKAPSLADLYSTSSSGQGDENLKAVEMMTYELGIEKQLSSAVNAKLVFYKSKSKNLIINKWIEPGLRKKTNVDLDPQGIEMEINTKLSDHLNGFLNYTYLDVGDLTYMTSRHMGNLGLSYQNRGLKADLVLRYQGEGWYWDHDAKHPDGGAHGGFTTADLRLSYQMKPNCEIGLSIENLFDKEYQYYEGYPMPGITVMGTINFKF